MSAAGTFRGTPRGGRPQPVSSYTDSPSAIPRPKLETAQSTASDAGLSNLTASRQKQSKRDEAIRKKIEVDLGKRKTNPARAKGRRAPPGTVLSLRPSEALQMKPYTTVAEAAQLMAAKREDCVLVTDDDETKIAGIFTAKDLAFRVVGEGIKASQVTIDQIMTKNPMCTSTETSATEALDTMVRRGFRHLPVMDENGDISGILDITKCFYDAMEKLERAYSSSRKLYDALEGVQAELGSSQPQQIIQYVEAIRQKMSGPTLESVLNGMPPCTVSVKTSVKEAASLMKEHHTTAVLVQDQGSITGIFTSKDIVLRVIAAGLDPANCSVVRVMTPHPDFAPVDMSIQSALRKMHDGHYLNLPVMSLEGEIVGMVDVLKLTYATLDQINTMSTGDSEGPAWNKFWMSIDQETESMLSGEGSHSHSRHQNSHILSPDLSSRSAIDRIDSVAPGDSASHMGNDSPSGSALAENSIHPSEIPFPFKFKAPSGRVHRLAVAPAGGIPNLVAIVAEKLGSEATSLGGVPTLDPNTNTIISGFALSYLDHEGDTVSITTSADLIDAVSFARASGREKVDLFVHHPDQPATINPTPIIVNTSSSSINPSMPTPPESANRDRKESISLRNRNVNHSNDEDDDDSDRDAAGEHVSLRQSSGSARNVRKRGGTKGETDNIKHRATSASSQKQVLKEQVVTGVPNELLLPGAIVTLAVVIAGVFTFTRSK